MTDYTQLGEDIADEMMQELGPVHVDRYTRRIKGKAVSVRQHYRSKRAHAKWEKGVRKELKDLPDTDFKRLMKATELKDKRYPYVQGEKSRRGSTFGSRSYERGLGEERARRQQEVVGKVQRRKAGWKNLNDNDLNVYATTLPEHSDERKAVRTELRRREKVAAAKKREELAKFRAQLSTSNDDAIIAAGRTSDPDEAEVVWSVAKQRASMLGNSRNQASIYLMRLAEKSGRATAEEFMPEQLKGEWHGFLQATGDHRTHPTTFGQRQIGELRARRWRQMVARDASLADTSAATMFRMVLERETLDGGYYT